MFSEVAPVHLVDSRVDERSPYVYVVGELERFVLRKEAVVGQEAEISCSAVAKQTFFLCAKAADTNAASPNQMWI